MHRVKLRGCQNTANNVTLHFLDPSMIVRASNHVMHLGAGQNHTSKGVDTYGTVGLHGNLEKIPHISNQFDILKTHRLLLRNPRVL